MSSSHWPPTDTFISRWGRIKLVPPEDKDDLDIVALRTDPETRRYLPSMPADLTLEQWKQRRKKSSQNEECWDLNIHFTSAQADTRQNDNSASGGNNTFVGVCGVFRIDGGNKTADVGILIRPELYRNYIATEALYCNLVLAFEHPRLELYRVQFVTAALNVRMRGWLERFGIAIDYRMREAWSDGKGGRMDAVVYSIFKPDWPALKDRLKRELDARLPVSNGLE